LVQLENLGCFFARYCTLPACYLGGTVAPDLHRVSALPCLLVELLLAGSAFADSQLNMSYLGHGVTTQNPVYSWYFHVHGVAATLICDTLRNENIQAETWPAKVTNILNGPTQGLFKGNTLIDLKAAAVSFSNILFHGANFSDANWAIWALFTPSAKNSKYFNADALRLHDAALAIASKLPKSFFANHVIYVPIRGMQPALSAGSAGIHRLESRA
jgi:hypothetical protein